MDIREAFYEYLDAMRPPYPLSPELAAFTAGAEWARKQTLEEAAHAIEGERLAFYRRNDAERGYEQGRTLSLAAIRALGESR